MAVLPHRFDNYDRRLGRNLAEHFDAVTLAVNKTVLLERIERMSPANATTMCPHSVHHRLFDAALGGPASLVGGEPQVATCHEYHFSLPHELPLLQNFGLLIAPRSEAGNINQTDCDHP